jgi:hypothetical protein
MKGADSCIGRAIMRRADAFSSARDATAVADKIPEITAGFP